VQAINISLATTKSLQQHQTERSSRILWQGSPSMFHRVGNLPESDTKSFQVTTIGICEAAAAD
jgi:hypothetical protein